MYGSGGRPPSLARLVGMHMSGTGVATEMPSRGARSLVLVFPTTLLSELTYEKELIVQPQTVFRPSRFTIDPESAPFVEITDIIVGRNSQFVNPIPIPGISFSPVCVGAELRLDTCNVGQFIKLKLKRTEDKVRVSASVRDGAELPESYKDLPDPVRRLHPEHLRSVGEIDFLYDWSFPIPDYLSFRVSTITAREQGMVYAPLEEPELRDMRVRVMVFGMTIDG